MSNVLIVLSGEAVSFSAVISEASDTCHYGSQRKKVQPRRLPIPHVSCSRAVPGPATCAIADQVFRSTRRLGRFVPSAECKEPLSAVRCMNVASTGTVPSARLLSMGNGQVTGTVSTVPVAIP
jgi:hypothetical protein